MTPYPNTGPTPRAPRPYAAPPPSPSPWLVRLPVLFVTGVLLIMLLLLTAYSVYRLAFAERIIPGVTAYGLDLGGLSPSQAAAALDHKFTYDDDTVFTFRDGDAFWQATAGDLGVKLDAQATAAQAEAIGHSGNLFADVLDQGLTWLNGEAVTPVVRYDQNAAAAFFSGLAAQIDRPVRDATLTVSGRDIQTTPAQSGRNLDISATLGFLNGTIEALAPGGEIPLVIRETPALAFDAEAAANRARAALSGPLLLVADDGRGNGLGPWTISVDQIAQLLRVESVLQPDGTRRYEVEADTGVYQPSLEALASGLIIPAKNARFHFDPATSQLINIQSSVSGRTLNVAETLGRIETAIFDPVNRVVPLAFTYELPAYHNDVTAAELGITELLSQATTNYAGSSQARIDNIATAASRFDGLIIAPGELFSFNAYVGDISPEEGFVPGKVIVGGRTVDGVGGGVCQVSTTAFQAAFYAGYPIQERHAHGYRVGYYENGEGVGMDAAIYNPDLDFRFYNDTDYHLLIETSVLPGSTSLQFRFYSTNPGRQVVKEGPTIGEIQPPAGTVYEVNPDLQPGQSLQVDWPAQGAYVEVTRIILDTNGQVLNREIFASQYQPWGAVVQVAPGDSRAG
ncbi:MAG TPA: VanW family protein [Candidatus Limnocylindrales bacterium]|nr:VanW family protein [Candidatus Limnocylindrales bacterium]